jgi:hypothetical protein
MAKRRSKINYLTQYNSYLQGLMIGIDQKVFAKAETVAGTFITPTLGTVGKSTSAAAPSTDISAETDTNFRIAVDGASVVAVTITPAGKTSGTLIAAELESAINAALLAAGQDGRVYVDFVGGLYEIGSQKIGTTSSVVITDGASLNIADTLKIGVANGGVEAVGTNGSDYLDTLSAKYSFKQERAITAGRTGRTAFGTLKRKKMLEGTIESYINIDTSAGSPSVDNAVDMMISSILPNKTTDGSTFIKYDLGQPQSTYFSLLSATNVENGTLNGCYNKTMEIDLQGDSEGKLRFSFKGRDEKKATILKTNGIVSASATVVTVAGEADSVEVGSLVMAVDADGKTVLYGFDGSLSVVSKNTGTNTIVLSSPITLANNSFIVPFNPDAFGGIGGTIAPMVELQGSVTVGGVSVGLPRSFNIQIDPKTSDLDNIYGTDSNQGFVVGSKADVKVKMDVIATPAELRRIIKIKEDTNFAVTVVLGSASGRRLEVVCPNVVFSVPSVDVPDSGETVISLEGFAMDSSLAAQDCVSVWYK